MDQTGSNSKQDELYSFGGPLPGEGGDTEKLRLEKRQVRLSASCDISCNYESGRDDRQVFRASSNCLFVPTQVSSAISSTFRRYETELKQRSAAGDALGVAESLQGLSSQMAQSDLAVLRQARGSGVDVLTQAESLCRT
jgi:hypothetical protein